MNRQRELRARKEYWCASCDDLISPGHKYIEHVWVQHDFAHWRVERTCLSCSGWRARPEGAEERRQTQAASDARRAIRHVHHATGQELGTHPLALGVVRACLDGMGEAKGWSKPRIERAQAAVPAILGASCAG